MPSAALLQTGRTVPRTIPLLGWDITADGIKRHVRGMDVPAAAIAVCHTCCGGMCRYLQGCPVRGEYDTGNVGRTPNSAIEPTGLPASPVEAEPESIKK
jgi:hypothetical protein